MSLGCGSWRAFITARGGGDLIVELPWSNLEMQRRGDDISDGSVGFATSNADDACCAAIATLEAWRHELALYRNGHLAWCGPVVDLFFSTDQVEIRARDLFQWFERRVFPKQIDIRERDLVDIFRAFVEAGLERDTSPNIQLSVLSDSGVLASRLVQVAERKRVADELRELARTGVDFTCVGRILYVSGNDIPFTPIGPLMTEDFPNPSLQIHGLQAATEVTVIGTTRGTSDRSYQGTVGGVSDDLGLVQVSVSEPKIRDIESALAAARSRLLLINPPPPYLSGALDPNAGVEFEDLIPGVHIDIRAQVGCREVITTMRLNTVDVSADVDDDSVSETVSLNLIPVGRLEESL